MSEPKEDRETEPAKVVQEATAQVLSSAQIFGTDREIWIDHDGTRYRLRITKRNKLILQK